MYSKKKDLSLIERGLTLYSTGKFTTRQEALEAARREKQRENKKKEPEIESCSFVFSDSFSNT